MGIKTVAVFSDVDRTALHVKMADEAIFIGSAEAKESYLSIEKIIQACKSSGADAVHPGYGFLSENSSFCDALTKAGITFIGPPASAIESMGDKIASKKIAVDAGIFTIPGTLAVVEDAQDAMKIADEIGYPVMIKASAGGGGKGMRIAYTQNEVLEGFASSQNEAARSFGDDRIFIEKFIARPRHIEIQILGDTFGNFVFFGERECSIQRRNQKIIEEAPSPFLTSGVREKMGEQAVALARSVGYFSAGTVEFVVDSDQNFYFLEMNTRLQVEHPVTELIYRIDLVKEMICIAAKKRIAYSQKDIKFNGWAIESRIYAEDPRKNFLPSTGRLRRYSAPSEVDTESLKIRNDTGVYEGASISIYYDPLIAKLCVWAIDRKIAIEKMRDALDRFSIEGIETNLNFLSAVMDNERFELGEFSTAFISEEFPNGFNYKTPDQKVSEYIAIIAACMQEIQENRNAIDASDNDLSKKQLKKVSVVGDEHFTFNFKRLNMKRFVFQRDTNDEFEVEIGWIPGDTLVSALVGNVKLNLKVKSTHGFITLEYREYRTPVQVFNPREFKLSKFMIDQPPVDVSSEILCPMPGLLVSLQVSVGDEVIVGQALCTIEAMKMENILRAEKNGSIKSISKKVGDTLAVNDVIIEVD